MASRRLGKGNLRSREAAAANWQEAEGMMRQTASHHACLPMRVRAVGLSTEDLGLEGLR